MLLRRRLLLLFVAIAAMVVLVGALTAVGLVARDDAQQRERQLSVAVERVAQLGTAYADQETGERGYVITGAPSFLQPYTKGRATAAELVRRLRPVIDTDATRRRLDAMTAAMAVWHDRSAQAEIALTRTGGPSAAAQLVADGSGQQRFDTVRRTHAALAGAVQADESAAEGRFDDLRNVLNGLFVATLFVAIGGVVVAAFLIRRWVTDPIDRFAHDVRRVRSGSIDAPIRIEGPPELASLAGDVDAMRGHIHEQLREAERSREAVEQSAAVVLTLRSELEPVVGDIPDGWSVAGRLRAAEGVVAGDSYDLFSAHGPNLALVVVDIAGHGATEGILALRGKEMLRTALTSGESPGHALATTAEVLGDMGDEVFLTAFVAVIDTDSGRVRYANAGHPPAYVVTSDGALALEPTGPLVGPLPPGWDTREVDLPPGGSLCAYTDGVTEARDAEQEFFGPERLLALLQGAGSEPAAAVVDRCLDALDRFASEGLRDDATIVVLCRAGAARD
jgi:sigma-B regulation protein RsbU (phosphoserine phosphatase)